MPWTYIIMFMSWSFKMNICCMSSANEVRFLDLEQLPMTCKTLKANCQQNIAQASLLLLNQRKWSVEGLTRLKSNQIKFNCLVLLLVATNAVNAKNHSPESSTSTRTHKKKHTINSGASATLSCDTKEKRLFQANARSSCHILQMYNWSGLYDAAIQAPTAKPASFWFSSSRKLLLFRKSLFTASWTQTQQWILPHVQQTGQIKRAAWLMYKSTQEIHHTQPAQPNACTHTDTHVRTQRVSFIYIFVYENCWKVDKVEYNTQESWIQLRFHFQHRILSQWV